jgi:hypothetical protein
MFFSYILDEDAQVQQQEQQFTPHIASGISGMELLILINAAVLAAMTFWCSMDICCPFKKNVDLGAPEDNPVESPVKLYMHQPLTCNLL